MKLLICGDTKPCEKNESLFINKNIKELVGNKMCALFDNSDFNIFNLECPLTISTKKIIKNGPNLKANPLCANFFDDKKDIVCLANNHIYDYGSNGFSDTLEELEKRNINHIGYVKNNNIFNKFKKDNLIIINVCEHEFSYNESLEEGAFCNDIFFLIKEIQKEKDNFIVIIYHGGKELYPYPTPNLQYLCRNLIDFGANLVVCQHSHCIGCFETYKQGKIVYGQGDFIFSSNNPATQYGMLISLDTKDINSIHYHFYVKQSNGTIRPTEKKEIKNEFIKRSEAIINSKNVKNVFDKYCKANGPSYISSLNPKNRIFNAINYRILKFYFSKHMSSKKITSLLNKIECEPHRETIEKYLKIKLEEKNKSIGR